MNQNVALTYVAKTRSLFFYIYIFLCSPKCQKNNFSPTGLCAHPACCSERKKKATFDEWVISWPVAAFPWQWQQIQLTLIAVVSSNLYVWEKASFCPHSIKAWSLPPLNMVIRAVVPPLFLSVHDETPTDPTRGKGGSWLLQCRLGGPGLRAFGKETREKERCRT